MAAEKNNVNALFNLGICYEEGIGMLRDDSYEAWQCFLQAERLGHPNARDRLWKYYGIYDWME